MNSRHGTKSVAKKITNACVWEQENWKVFFGILKRGRGRPHRKEQLFSVVAEKIPFEALSGVAKDLKENGISPNGVYVAHDSMGYARYVGRGHVVSRLRARKGEQKLELQYFSFYIVADKKHEREIETLLIRAGGPHLAFNSRKKRVDIKPGNVRDFEAGTKFYERQYKRGRNRKRRRGRPGAAK
jgi:hypothetical protein